MCYFGSTSCGVFFSLLLLLFDKKRGGQQKDMCTHKALMLMDVEKVVAVEEKGEKVALLMAGVGEV